MQDFAPNSRSRRHFLKNSLAAGAYAKYSGARTYTDWREMLETEGDKIDAVVVSTQDHLHAISAMAAI